MTTKLDIDINSEPLNKTSDNINLNLLKDNNLLTIPVNDWEVIDPTWLTKRESEINMVLLGDRDYLDVYNLYCKKNNADSDSVIINKEEVDNYFISSLEIYWDININNLVIYKINPHTTKTFDCNTDKSIIANLNQQTLPIYKNNDETENLAFKEVKLLDNNIYRIINNSTIIYYYLVITTNNIDLDSSTQDDKISSTSSSYYYRYSDKESIGAVKPLSEIKKTDKTGPTKPKIYSTAYDRLKNNKITR